MVRSWLVAALAVSLLVAGPLAISASAEDAATAVPKAHVHKKHAAAKARPAKEADTAAPAAMATGDITYPPCSRSLRDKCIELNQLGLNRAFPSCSRTAGVQKAACIETAFKEQKPAQ